MAWLNSMLHGIPASVFQGTANIEYARYTWGHYKDTTRFWEDYYKNTGYRPRYPYKSGAIYNIGSVYQAEANIYSYYSRLFR